jgi:hypothetical protein
MKSPTFVHVILPGLLDSPLIFTYYVVKDIPFKFLFQGCQGRANRLSIVKISIKIGYRNFDSGRRNRNSIGIPTGIPTKLISVENLGRDP